MPAINGIALHEPGENVDAEILAERAWEELLRQEAVRRGYLPRSLALTAPRLTADDQQIVQQMLDEAVPPAQPSGQECRRHYDANPALYTQGQAARMRHILFAVTEGVDVDALARRAEEALLDLKRMDAPPDRFAQLAAQLSNCPSGADGGYIGWVEPGELAGELTREIFQQQVPTQGLHPRLMHSRYGMHVVEILERRPGRRLPFEQVRARISAELAQRSRATALHQYIRLVAGRALVEGVAIETATTPLVQ